SGYINRVYFTDSLTGWIGGDRIMKTSNSGTNWTTQILDSSGTGINDMFFLNRNTGFAIGNNYMSLGSNYYRTTNGGDNWTYLPSTVTYGKFDGISATSKDTVFFTSRNSAGLNGYIYRSIDGGNSWSLIKSFSEQIYCIRFTDNNTGFVCGRAGLLYKSTDKGLNWTQISGNTLSSLFRMYFLNSNTGWAYGSSGTIIKTTNGGMNWNVQLSMSDDVYIKSVHFLNQNTGIAVGIFSSIDSVPTFVTVNGGNTWNNLYNITNNIADICIISNNRLCEVGNGGRILFSNTMGYSVPDAPNLQYPLNYNSINTLYPLMSWSTVQYAENYNIQISQHNNFDTLSANTVVTNPSFTPGLCILSRNRNYYWRVRSNNFVGFGPWSLVYTFNTFGNSSYWYRQMTADTLDNNCAYMADSVNCWIVGNNGRYIRTNSGGDCWENGYLPESKNLRSVYSVKPNICWIAGDNGLIYRSTNRGISWTNQSIQSQANLNSSYFFNQDTGFVAGNEGIIFKTYNSGINWISAETGIGNKINSINFIDNQTGWVCCDSGLVLRTTNQGNNWVSCLTNTYVNLRSIWFLNSNTGFFAGDSGIIAKTTNSGINWAFQNSRLKANLRSILFTSENIGWVVGDSGYISATSNSGSTWYPQKVSDASFNSLSFKGIKYGLTCGNNGKVYATQNGGHVSVDINNNQVILSRLYLSQNYPNPFNPLTKIKYSIEKTTFVSLKVFDILGKEVQTLVNESKAAGTYESIFEASRYSSGVYYYRLTAEGYSETRKMVVIK
ncbi:MAG: YCF48-related protein, partial [Bacteroidetes bacterium]|nr:YCF48-related protein [Bacteroidota bacterium]